MTMLMFEDTEEVLGGAGLFEALDNVTRAVVDGVRNFYEGLQLTIDGAFAVSSGAALATPEVRTEDRITAEIPVEHEAIPALWERSKKHLRSLIDGMLAGKPPSIGADTAQLASKAVAAAHARGQVDVQAWAASLASEVDDLND